MASTPKPRYELEVNIETFRKRLRELIDSHGYTYADVEFYTGITSATVSRYLSAQRLPDMKYILVFCKHFGVSSDWLMGLNDEKPDSNTPELLFLYNRASLDDKAVVDTVLKKYRK